MTRSAALFTLALVVVGCGGDGGEATTSTSDGATSTSPPASTIVTTTTIVDTGPLADLIANPVQDPLLDTGFHEMEYGDETHTFLVSTGSLMGSDASANRLAVAALEPTPATTGVGTDEQLLAVWIDNWSGDIAPTGFALYSLGEAGWTAVASAEADEILAFLDTTTDYESRRPDGPPVLQTVLTQFDWTETAHFIAGVGVYDLFLPDAGAAFEGQIECTIDPALSCALLSDDGVLRRGDEGEEVRQLQQWLVEMHRAWWMGYLPDGTVTEPTATGVFDEDTELAVRLFQRDFGLVVDGRAGPQTLAMIERAVNEDLFLLSTFGLTTTGGSFDDAVFIGQASLPAWQQLIELLGEPVDTPWYVDGCDGHFWYKSTWGGFTAIFTDRSGSPEFDGWVITDLNDLPADMYVIGGFGPGTTWADVEAEGAVYNAEEAYGGFFGMRDSLGYEAGRLDVYYPDGPVDDALVTGFGYGTGGFISC